MLEKSIEEVSNIGELVRQNGFQEIVDSNGIIFSEELFAFG
jgi:hypothetical protein